MSAKKSKKTVVVDSDEELVVTTKDKNAGGKKRKASDEETKDEVMSADKFKKEAKELKIVIDGTEYTAEPKEFSSGSYGWGLAGKVLKVKVGEEEVSVQVSINLPIRGSKKK